MARPRSEEARRKALAAAIDLIVERGVGNLEHRRGRGPLGCGQDDDLPSVAGTGLADHRRRPGTFEHIGTPDTGSLRGDLEAYFGGLIRADLSGPAGRIMPCIIDAASRDPEIETAPRPHRGRAPAADPHDRRSGPGARRTAGRSRPRIVFGTIVGPIVFRKVVQRQPIDAGYVEACLDVAITGLAATAPAGSRPQSVASGDR